MTGLGFKSCYRRGVELAAQLEPVSTYEEIGAQLGVSKQYAYTETMLALGKLAILLERDLRLDIRALAADGPRP